jgi:ATP-dependent Clp protease ATP-binding subunit ClpC
LLTGHELALALFAIACGGVIHIRKPHLLLPGMAIYERFTDRSRKVMRLAEAEARRYTRKEIDTEHLLLALAREGHGVAAHILKALGADAARIRVEMEALGGDCRIETQGGALNETSRVTRIVDYAMDEARGLGHNYVGTEHLLLGMLREPEGMAMEMLLRFGLSASEVRQEVLSLLGHA